MFEDLRAAFKEALDNFNKELSRDNVSGTADKLLIGMKNEIADEKAAVSGLEDDLSKTLGQIERLEKESATAKRRAEMAQGIDDEETVNAALQYLAKVDGHKDVLAKKAAALKEELDFRRGTVKEMFARYHEAKEKRDALTATTGRSGARESITAASDLFDELDRMAEKIEGDEARGEAAEAFDELDLDGGSEFRVDVDEPPPDRELDVDAALEELKRRMGES